MRSGRGGFRGRYGCWVRFRIRDPEAERTERRTVRVRPPHFPTTSNRAPHSEPRTPEISALWAGLVPSTVHAWLGARAQLFHHPTRPSPTPPARHRMLYGPRAHKSFVLHPPPHAITCEDPHECLCASATWHICPADSAMRIHAHAMASSKFPVPRSHDPPSAFPCRFRLASRRLARRMPWPPAAEAPRRRTSRRGPQDGALATWTLPVLQEALARAAPAFTEPVLRAALANGGDPSFAAHVARAQVAYGT